jgi:hypothetical protein
MLQKFRTNVLLVKIAEQKFQYGKEFLMEIQGFGPKRAGAEGLKVTGNIRDDQFKHALSDS